MLGICLYFNTLILTLVIFLSFPFLIILISLALFIYILLLLPGLSSKLLSFLSILNTWLLYKSGKPRRLIWKIFYRFLHYIYPQDQSSLNYGYASISDEDPIICLSPEEEQHKFSYHLYHYIATGFNKLSNLKGLSVLDVGSGRGGGLAYICKTLKPYKATGIDYSKPQISYSKSTYNIPNLNFIEGDAEKLPFEANSFELVITIESSHCFVCFQKFIEEARRVLKVGGICMITDFFIKEGLERMEREIKAGFEVVEKKDITENVVKALKIDRERRGRMILKRSPVYCRRVLRKFCGCEGLNSVDEFKSGRWVYLAYKLVKLGD